MSNDQLDSVWMFNKVSVFNEAIKLSRMQEQRAQQLHRAQPYVSMPDVQQSDDQTIHKTNTGTSNGLIIRFAGMTAGVIAIAVIATVGLLG